MISECRERFKSGEGLMEHHREGDLDPPGGLRDKQGDG